MKSYQPEHALLACETRKENHDDLAKMLAQIAMERADRLPPPSSLVCLEAQFEDSIRQIRADVQRTKDAQTADILRWLQS